jgi:hypothetical protein
MNERVVAILLAALMVAGASLRAEELPRLNQDEIALLVASWRNYSSDEVTELLTMVITIAEEELEREEAERREVAALLESCEIAAEVRDQVERRERWRVRVTWALVGAVVGAVVAGGF